MKKRIYEIKRSNRKTMEIKINVLGEVMVCVPNQCSNEQADAMVQQKMEWIETHIKELREKAEQSVKISLFDGARIPLYDKTITLKVDYYSGLNEARMEYKQEVLYVSMPHEDAQWLFDCVAVMYKKIGKPIFYARAKMYGQIMGITFNNIAIKDQKTRWGSCSSKQNLNFNWKLLILPPELFDYVVVHELSHLIEMNHSKAFWEEVEKVLPDYKEREEKIKQYSPNYMFEFRNSNGIV